MFYIYPRLRRRMAESKSDHDFFLFDPHGNEGVARIYDLAIETSLQANHFHIILACELTNGGSVDEVVTNAVLKAKLIVADLTGE